MITEAQHQAAILAARKFYRARKDVRSKMCREWLKYNAENPEVYETFVRLLRDMKKTESQWSIQGAMEVARWQLRLDVNRKGKFKFPNEYGAYYARLIMMQELDLYGFMRVKPSEADHELGWNYYKTEMDRAEKKRAQGTADGSSASDVAI